MSNIPLVLLAHGFNVRDKGQGTIGRLMPFIASRQMDALLLDFGWMGLVQVRTQNRKHARKVADAVQSAKLLGRPVYAIGHSNGCCVLHLATTVFHAPIERIAYINPALDEDLEPAPQVKTLHVWHSPSDRAVQAADLLPWHTWGDMGAVGYTGSDSRVKNFNKELMAIPSVSHSDFAEDAKLGYYGPLIIEELLK